MLLSALIALCNQALPNIDDVYKRVEGFSGVEINAEMVRPSNVPMTFKISRAGWMSARYPTSVEFIGPVDTVTWMPDRREYSKRKREAGSPVPSGFEPLWPGAKRLIQASPTKEAEFQGQPCYQMDCKSEQPWVIQLFVDKANLYPKGSRVDLNGTTYEIVFKTVTVRRMDPKHLRFVPPKDARESQGGNPNDRLIKPGKKLADFSALDLKGVKVTLRSLLKGKDGLVLNFWFSSCTGCIAEMPFLKSLYPKLTKSNIALVGVNPVDSPQVAAKTSLTRGLPYTTLVGSGTTKIRDLVGVVAYPVTVIVNREGVVVDVIPVPDEKLIVAGLRKLVPSLPID